MKKIKIIFIAGVILFGLLQFIRPGIPIAHKAKLLTDVPDSVAHIIEKSCFDCHSSQTDLRWFDKVTPVNFLVASHIKEGRKAFNFEKYDGLNTAGKNAMLFYALNQVQVGEMPLPSYTMVHQNAKVSQEEMRILKKYLTGISPRKPVDTVEINSNSKKYNDLVHAGESKNVKQSLNGINYIPDYRGWKAISTSDRFDNGTMRIIYANDVAVKAIQDGKTKVWADGTVFAKAAWKQQTNTDGTISMGAFKQVEFMIKDSKKYAATEGWGWARWLGDELVSYGKNADFPKECISCHTPVKDNDYVFTAPLNLKKILINAK